MKRLAILGDLFVTKHFLHVMKRDIHVMKRALCIIKRDLHIMKRLAILGDQKMSPSIARWHFCWIVSVKRDLRVVSFHNMHRALFIMHRALFIRDIHVMKRDIHVMKRALCIIKRDLHIMKSARFISWYSRWIVSAKDGIYIMKRDVCCWKET